MSTREAARWNSERTSDEDDGGATLITNGERAMCFPPRSTDKLNEPLLGSEQQVSSGHGGGGGWVGAEASAAHPRSRLHKPCSSHLDDVVSKLTRIFLGAAAGSTLTAEQPADGSTLAMTPVRSVNARRSLSTISTSMAIG